MSVTCHECGVALADGAACIDHFHALLLLESEVAADPVEAAGGRGEVAHFYAVSAYVLQHPEGMGYTAGALDGLRRAVADHLAGRVTLAGLRPRVRHAADGPARITRRAGDEVPRWPVAAWPMTVADVVSGGVEGYGERAASWAESVIRTLDAAAA
jgi:hypothetical protein